MSYRRFKSASRASLAAWSRRYERRMADQKTSQTTTAATAVATKIMNNILGGAEVAVNAPV